MIDEEFEAPLAFHWDRDCQQCGCNGRRGHAGTGDDWLCIHLRKGPLPAISYG